MPGQADKSGGKLGRLRRLRAGSLSIPVAHPERVRGERVRNAMRLKELVGRFYDDARAGEAHGDPDSYEPPMTRPPLPKQPTSVARSFLLPGGSGFDDEDDE